MNQKIELSSSDDTEALGAHLARVCSRGVSIHLVGALAIGKTTLARGYLRGLGYAGAVKSPTFTLVETYNFLFGVVHHFDLYRIEIATELDQIGIDEYFTEGADCLIEWPSRGRGVLPVCDIEICLNAANLNRYAEIYARSERGDIAVSKLNSLNISMK